MLRHGRREEGIDATDRPQSKAALQSSGALRGGLQGGFANTHPDGV